MGGPADDGAPARVLQLRVVVEAERMVTGSRRVVEVALDAARRWRAADAGAAAFRDLACRCAPHAGSRATLEIANPAQKRMIDEVEVGRQVAPRIRLAFEVADTATVATELVAGGADLVAPPVVTPWQSLNARFDAPAGLHITVFQEPAAEA